MGDALSEEVFAAAMLLNMDEVMVLVNKCHSEPSIALCSHAKHIQRNCLDDSCHIGDKLGMKSSHCVGAGLDAYALVRTTW